MDLRTLLNEVKTFLLGLSKLEDYQNAKRVQLLGSLEIWLYKLTDADSAGRRSKSNVDSRVSTNTVLTEKSYESITDRNLSYLSSAYDEFQDESSDNNTNSNSSAVDSDSPVPGPRREIHSEQVSDSSNSLNQNERTTKATSSLIGNHSSSSLNLNSSDQCVKHTGRLGPSLNLLRKAVTKPQMYYAALLSDRLILKKSIRDTKPWQEIRLFADSVCEQQGKVGLRITEPTTSGRIQSHSFSCQNSDESHTWVDVINEVIRNLHQSPCSAVDTPVNPPIDESDGITDSEECLSSMSLDNVARQKNSLSSMAKSVPRRWVRRFSKEVIKHQCGKLPLSESPYGPVLLEEGNGVGGELHVKAASIPNTAGQSVVRHCRVTKGLFSVYLNSESTEPEFTFPLQCCDLVPDPHATNEELKFRIVQGTLEKISCEALDQMSHFNWLKHLSKVITNVSATVPEQLLASTTGQSDDKSIYEEEWMYSPLYLEVDEDSPHDDFDDYQIPISLKRFNPGLRQTLMSIRQSFTDEGAMPAPDEAATHRSHQNLHQTQAPPNVKRSHSTRPLYNLAQRQNLSTKACRRLLPDIERCLDLTEERQGDSYDDYNGARPLSPSPALPPHHPGRCESAIYVEATALPATEVRHSSGSVYSSASTGAGSGAPEEDDLLLSTAHYSRQPAPGPLSSPEEENIYEDVQVSLTSRPGRTLTDGANGPPPTPPNKPRRVRTFAGKDADPAALMRDLAAAAAARAKTREKAEVAGVTETATETEGEAPEATVEKEEKEGEVEKEKEPPATSKSPPKLPPKPRKVQRSPYVGKKPLVKAQSDFASGAKTNSNVVKDVTERHPMDAS